jgi:hypothetical protein
MSANPSGFDGGRVQIEEPPCSARVLRVET